MKLQVQALEDGLEAELVSARIEELRTDKEAFEAALAEIAPADREQEDDYRRPAQARGRWSRVPEDHARLRADGRQARPLPLRPRQRPLPGAGRWGTRDPALKVDTHGEAARRAAGVETIHRPPGKHFPKEDQAPAIADLVAGITRG